MYTEYTGTEECLWFSDLINRIKNLVLRIQTLHSIVRLKVSIPNSKIGVLDSKKRVRIQFISQTEEENTHIVH